MRRAPSPAPGPGADRAPRRCGGAARAGLVAGLLVAVGAALPAALLAGEPAPRPRAALVAGAPLVPGAAALAVLRKKLESGYKLLDDPKLAGELETLDQERSPEQLVYDALREAIQRMRRLAMEEVQRTLQDAEPYLQQLPPTPAGRALLSATVARKAHVALILGDNATAAQELQRGLSADPDFALDQAQEPPTLVELFERVRGGLRTAAQGRLRVVTTPPGAMVVLAGRPLGRAPLEVRAPADTAVVIWAVQDGFQPRNVTARPAGTSGPQRTLSVEIRLDPLPPARQLRPLVDALREAAPRARPGAAQSLMKALGVEAVVVAQLGPGDRPQLSVYGAAPRFSGPPPLDLDLDLRAVTPPPRRAVPPWLWGVIGAVAGGAVVTGAILASPH